MVGWPVCGAIGPQRLGDCLGGGLAPVRLAGLIGPGVCWGWLARLVGPGCWGWPRLLGRLAGVCSDWGGLVGSH